MPRPAKGARLVWRKESRKADGSLRSSAGWFIEDGGKRVSTGFGRAERDDAEKVLSIYIAKKHTPVRERNRDPDYVKVADVVRVYNRDVVPNQSRPKETASRLVPIVAFFGEKSLAEINGQLCRDYVAQASSVPAARRQLEDLRAAIRHYHAEGYVTTIPVIVMPEKSEARIRWLTRQEAAKLIRAAWRMRQTWKGRESDRRTGQHVARFILVGLYTGTRSAAICGAALEPTEGRGFVDLARGVFYRKGQGQKETKKRQPAVRIPDRLLAHMRRWARTPVTVKTEGRGKSKSAGRFVSHDYVVEWNGAPVGSVKKAFKAACEAAGLGWYETIDGERVFKTDVTPHVLRHTAATWLMQNGSTLTEASDYLGMTEQVLRDTYYHQHPDFQAEAAARITAKKPVDRAPSNVVRMR
jgi:integrase